MISCSSKLPSMRVTRREDLAVQLAEEALTEGDIVTLDMGCWGFLAHDPAAQGR